MKRKKICEGRVELRDKKYQYEFYTDNRNVYVIIYHPGKKGGTTQFIRNDKLSIKMDMDAALNSNGVYN